MKFSRFLFLAFFFCLCGIVHADNISKWEACKLPDGPVEDSLSIKWDNDFWITTYKKDSVLYYTIMDTTKKNPESTEKIYLYTYDCKKKKSTQVFSTTWLGTGVYVAAWVTGVIWQNIYLHGYIGDSIGGARGSNFVFNRNKKTFSRLDFSYLTGYSLLPKDEWGKPWLACGAYKPFDKNTGVLQCDTYQNGEFFDYGGTYYKIDFENKIIKLAQ